MSSVVFDPKNWTKSRPFPVRERQVWIVDGKPRQILGFIDDGPLRRAVFRTGASMRTDELFSCGHIKLWARDVQWFAAMGCWDVTLSAPGSDEVGVLTVSHKDVVQLASVNPEYKGLGAGLFMYELMLHELGQLKTDLTLQPTEDALRVWKSLTTRYRSKRTATSITVYRHMKGM